MKIRSRLTIWYIAVTLTILLAFSLGTYFGMKSLLYTAIDKEINILVTSIERSYDPLTGSYNAFDDVDDIVNRYIQYYLVVYNSDGIPIYSSPIAQRIDLHVPLSKSGKEQSFTIKKTIKSRVPYIHAGKKGEITFRTINKQFFINGENLGWITAGISIERIEESMNNLLKVLIAADILGVLLIGTGGYFLTRKALQPVDLITKRANQISHSNLNDRINIVNEEDELGKLSRVLNNLLERLQRAFESQKNFLADAAHELKTPLSILRSHWEGELNNPEISLDMKEKMVHDVETITRLNHLINNLLLLSQTETIQSNFDFKEMNLDEVLKEVISDAGILSEMKNQKIEVIEMPHIKMKGDKLRLYQLFFNLIDNAIKYTQEDGSIWISLREKNNSAIVEIRDNGPGIPQEDIDHIFERFYRVQKDRNRKTGGSGLGLSICKLIAESHNGTCTVNSGEGSGTSFVITLPVNDQNQK